MRHQPHVYIPSPWHGSVLELSDLQQHHLLKVLRLESASPVSYTDGSGIVGSGTLHGTAVQRGAEHDVFPHIPESPRPGIVAYTATRWGHLLDPKKMPTGDTPPPARDCYRFALSHPAADMVLCGPANREQMQEALRALDAGPLDADEMARMHRIGDHVYARYKPQFKEKGDGTHPAT